MKEILIELIRVAPIALGYLAGKWHRKSKPIKKSMPRKRKLSSDLIQIPAGK